MQSVAAGISMIGRRGVKDERRNNQFSEDGWAGWQGPKLLRQTLEAPLFFL
jgi:hypothetical protein